MRFKDGLIHGNSSIGFRSHLGFGFGFAGVGGAWALVDAGLVLLKLAVGVNAGLLLSALAVCMSRIFSLSLLATARGGASFLGP
jgi:hypothetical protein